MSISEDQFSMYGDSDNENEMTLNEASPKMEVLGAEEGDEESSSLPWLKSVFNLSNTSVGAGTLSPLFLQI